MASETKVQIIIEALNKATNEINTVARQVGGLEAAGGRATRGFLGVQTAIGGISRALAPLAAQLAAAFSIIAITRFIQHTINAADELKKFAEEVGESVDKIGGLSFGARLSGLNDSQFQTGMRQFAKQIAEASDEGSRAQDVFTAIGVAAIDATRRTRPLGDVLLDVAEKFRGWEDGAKKARIAQELFGSRNSRFINFLNAGREGIQGLVREFATLTGVSLEEAAKKAEEFNDSFTRLQTLIGGIALQVASDLMPRITNFIESVVKASSESNAWTTSLKQMKDVLTEIGAVMVFVTMSVANAVDAFQTLKQIAGTFKQSGNRDGWRAWLHDMVGTGDTFRQGVNRAAIQNGESPPFAEGSSASQAASDATKLLNDMLGRTVERYDQALEKAKSLIQLTRQAASAEPAKDGTPAAASKGQPAKTQPPNILSTEEQIKLRLAEIDSQRNQAQAAYEQGLLNIQDQVQQGALTESEAFARRKEEIDSLQKELVDVLLQYEALQEKFGKHPEIADRITRTETEIVSGRVEKNAPRFEGPQNFRQGWDEWFSAFQNNGPRIRAVFATINTAISGVASGISGLITGTQSWGEAMQNTKVAVINALVEIGVQQVAQAALSKSIQLGQALIAKATGAQIAVGYAPAVAATNTATFGASSAVGLAITLAAIAAIVGALSAFREGGMVRGPGGPRSDSVIARLSAGEGVITAEAVQHYGGARFIQAINRRMLDIPRFADGGVVGPALQNLAPTVNLPEQRFAFAMFDDLRRLEKWAESMKFAGYVVKVIQANKHEAGIS